MVAKGHGRRRRFWPLEAHKGGGDVTAQNMQLAGDAETFWPPVGKPHIGGLRGGRAVGKEGKQNKGHSVRGPERKTSGNSRDVVVEGGRGRSGGRVGEGGGEVEGGWGEEGGGRQKMREMGGGWGDGGERGGGRGGEGWVRGEAGGGKGGKGGGGEWMGCVGGGGRGEKGGNGD